MSVRPLALFPVVALAVLLSVMTVVAPCLAADRPASVTAKVTPPTREGERYSLDNAATSEKKEAITETGVSPSEQPGRADAATRAADEQRESEPTFSWGGYFKAIGMLFIVLALLWYVVWHLKRKGAIPGVSRGSLPKGALRIEGSLPVGPRKGLLVVRFLNQRLLLGVTDHQITLITELKDHEANDTGSRQAAADESGDAGRRRNIDFEAVMRAIGNRKNTPED